MNDERTIQLRRPDGTVAREIFPKHGSLRFPVTPPLQRLSSDHDGVIVRLHADEGWIDVRLLDGKLEIRGAHPLAVEMHSSNLFRVALQSEDRADDEAVS